MRCHVRFCLVLGIILMGCGSVLGVGEERFYGGASDGAALGTLITPLPSAMIQRYQGGALDGAAGASLVRGLPAAATARFNGGAFDGVSASRAVNLPNPLSQDSDGDLMPDWWELLYYTRLTSARGSEDNDGDGMLNEDEYIADTNPATNSSVFRVTQFAITTNVAVQFTCSTQRVYGLEYVGTPATGAEWSPVPGQTNVIGTGTVMVLRDTSPAVTSRFYRVNVRLP
jgi:hypothetical protein